MPFSSPHHLRQQHVRLYTSSARESGVEHLTHMDRLASTRLSPRTGIVDAPEVDFRTNATNNERITLAMATRLRRECEYEESKIRFENENLMKRLEVHASTEDRRRHHVNLVPVEDKKPFPEQASNIVARRREANRIADANETLMFAMATLKPTVQNAKIKQSVDNHNQLVKRISKFKPSPRYCGEELLHSGRSASGSRRSVEASSSTTQLPSIGWRDVSPHDVRKMRRETDKSVRSVFLRNEQEVLQEAAASTRASNVDARRLTWTELGLQAARVPAPPSREL